MKSSIVEPLFLILTSDWSIHSTDALPGLSPVFSILLVLPYGMLSTYCLVAASVLLKGYPILINLYPPQLSVDTIGFWTSPISYWAINDNALSRTLVPVRLFCDMLMYYWLLSLSMFMYDNIIRPCNNNNRQ